MTTAQLLIVCTTIVLLSLLAFALIVWPTSRRQQGPSRVGERVNVHLKHTDDLLHGVITGDYEDRLVLEHAEYATVGAVTPLSTPQHILVADIARVEVFGRVVHAGPQHPSPVGA